MTDEPTPLLDLPPAQPRDLRFAVLDLETTGGCPTAKWDKEGRFRAASTITEVGVVQLQGAIRQDGFQSLVALESDLPPLIQRLTGITPWMLRDAPSWERVALDLAPVLEGRVWVAHHAPFDGSFLKVALPQGLWGRHSLVCTRLLARKLVPELGSRSLATLCAHFGIVNVRAHRALADAEATAELMGHLLDRADAAGWDAETFFKVGSVDWKKL